LAIGETLTQAEVEYRFGTNFGYQFKGITYRNPDGGRYVILLANEGPVYDDSLGDGRGFTYVGEGVPEKGDQVETVANRALLDAVQETFPIYLFTSTDGEDRYQYRGLVAVVDAAYVDSGGRKVYQFQMRRLETATWTAYTDHRSEIEASSTGEPTVDADRERTAGERPVRDTAFRRRVRALYDDRCVACGARRHSPAGVPEVEAAHLYPVAAGGPDDLRNGITLCRTHHWAFDHGWFGATDDREIVVADGGDRDPPPTVARLAGDSLRDPDRAAFTPHPTYLAAHRRYHGIE
jgi:Predicted restriction endonuclease